MDTCIGAFFRRARSSCRYINYQCRLYRLTVIRQQMYAVDETTEDSFWKLAQSGEDETCLLLSSSTLRQLDFRVRSHPLPGVVTSLTSIFQSQDSSSKMFAVPRIGEVFTSVEGAFEDQLIRICSTSQILWIDRRYSTKPVVAVHHGRRFDRTLRTSTMTFADSERICCFHLT